MVRTPLASGELAAVFRHYGDAFGHRDELQTNARAMLLQMDSQLWWRSLRFETWPYPLTQIIHPRVTCMDEQLVVGPPFFKANLCCVDLDMRATCRQLFADAQEMVSNDEFISCLRTWARVGKLLNMEIERLLARMKAAMALGKGQVPDVLRAGATGLLSQWRLLHEASGGEDLSEHTRKQLQRAGCPIVAGRAARASNPSRRRPHVAFINARSAAQKAAAQAANLQWSRHDHAQSLRTAGEEWQCLSQADKDRWSDEHFLKVEADIDMHVRGNAVLESRRANSH